MQALSFRYILHGTFKARAYLVTVGVMVLEIRAHQAAARARWYSRSFLQKRRVVHAVRPRRLPLPLLLLLHPLCLSQRTVPRTASGRWSSVRCCSRQVDHKSRVHAHWNKGRFRRHFHTTVVIAMIFGLGDVLSLNAAAGTGGAWLHDLAYGTLGVCDNHFENNRHMDVSGGGTARDRHLVGWLVVGWFVSWLVGWLLVGWLVGWLAGWLAGWLVGWLID
jgi:hypothetical protein